MNWIFVVSWLLLSICIVLIGKLMDNDNVVGVGGVMLLMTAMVQAIN